MSSGATQFHRLSVEDVFGMVEAGLLSEDDRVELIDGVLVDVSPPSPQHSSTVAWLSEHFAPAVGPGRQVRVQDLLLIEGGFVLPDLMVADRLPHDRHPSTAALVVEVAITTHRHDTWKAERYAGARIPEYWIVDLPGRELIVHRRPGSAGYRELTRHTDGDVVPTGVGAPDVDVSALLGPVD